MLFNRLLGPLVAAMILVPAATALAGPTVTVRVEGRDVTLLPATTVTLPDAKAPGNPCSGTAAALTKGAALEEATRGNWDRADFTKTILGESHTFAENDYWAVWLNEKYANGICSDADQLQDGDRVLLLVDISGPPSYAPSVFAMTLAAPATVAPGVAFAVTATEYRSADGSPGQSTPTPAGEVAITGGGATVTTGDDGTASVRLTARGPATLRASRSRGARSEPVSVCVTDGADGFCGTRVPGAAPGPATATTPLVRTPDIVAAFAKIASVTEGKRFAKGRGPRTLAGVVDAEPAGIRDVRLRLSRTRSGRCTRYDGERERLVKARCGIRNAPTFSVGDDARFSYLLPAALPAGRYVLDVIVIDRAGNRTTTYQRTRNRVVFHVA